MDEFKNYTLNFSFFERFTYSIFGIQYFSFKELFYADRIQFNASQIKNVYLFRGKPKLIEVEMNKNIRQFFVTKEINITAQKIVNDNPEKLNLNYSALRFIFNRLFVLVASLIITCITIAFPIVSLTTHFLSRFFIESKFCDSNCTLALNLFSLYIIITFSMIIYPFIIYILNTIIKFRFKTYAYHTSFLGVFILSIPAVIDFLSSNDFPYRSYFDAMKYYRRQPADISLQLDNQQNLDFINQIHILKNHYLFKYLLISSLDSIHIS